MQCIDAPLSLNHREGWLDLPTKPRGLIPEDRNTEATFAVDEADDPLRETWPFLLIVRTGRIFTFHVSTQSSGCDMNEYRRILGVSSIWPASHARSLKHGAIPGHVFRGVYLRHFCYYSKDASDVNAVLLLSGQVISAWLLMSP